MTTSLMLVRARHKNVQVHESCTRVDRDVVVINLFEMLINARKNVMHKICDVVISSLCI